ncbi:MAG: DUF190 domain-containing protein, partial [Thermodesulfobacteriota bacterium]
RGFAGCYESGETVTTRIEILSFNMPVRVYIVVPAAQAGRVLDGLSDMVTDGIVALHDLNVVSHRARNAFFPRQLLVRDVMTAGPRSVSPETPLSDVTRMLLSSVFTGVPVVDEQGRPIGVITQGDLIRKGGLPLRLGLLAESDKDRLAAVLSQMAARKAGDVMTGPAVLIDEDRPLAEAVELMVSRNVKRLPVVDEKGRLAGMVSRLDIFRTVMREAPDWNAFRAQKIDVAHLKRVADIARRDTHTVLPDTPIGEVIRVIGDNDIQRVAVVDGDGKLLGLISDRDLLRCFKQRPSGIWNRLSRVGHPFKQDAAGEAGACMATTAGQVMTTELITAGEEMLIEDAVSLMVDRGLKRLPVVDAGGRFAGMISRDSLLRTGFGPGM